MATSASNLRTLEIMGMTVPALGLGTRELRGHACTDVVEHALAIGYRHLDTAQMFENEGDIGRALSEAGVDRSELFVTTKLAPHRLKRRGVVVSTEDSLRDLDTDYVDLLLINWPSAEVPLEETLAAMSEVRERGLTRRIGVSNFPPSLVRQARAIAEIFCDQVEYHPYLSQARLLKDVRDEGLLLTAACPLARGTAIADETIGEIARARGRAPAQIALRWLVQQGVAAIPRASSAAHLQENLEIFDFDLSEEEMRRITALGGERRLVDPPWAPDWERGS